MVHFGGVSLFGLTVFSVPYTSYCVSLVVCTPSLSLTQLPDYTFKNDSIFDQYSRLIHFLLLDAQCSYQHPANEFLLNARLKNNIYTEMPIHLER